MKWDTGATNSYRMGREGQYDLKLADSGNIIPSPNEAVAAEKEDLAARVEADKNILAPDHPAKLLKNSCIKLIEIMSVSIGLHAERMQKSAVFNLVAMFRDIIANKIAVPNLGLDQSTILGFLRAMATSHRFCVLLTTDAWTGLYFRILENDENSEDVLGKIQCLRLLQNALQKWDQSDRERMVVFVSKMMTILSRLCVYCPNDESLMQHPCDVKSKVLLTAPHTSTVAEEIIVLFKRLFNHSVWRSVISEYLSQKLCVAADLYAQETQQNSSEDAMEIVSSLNLIGGYDPRPRIGATFNVDGNRGTVAGFSKRGSVLIYYQLSNEMKKVSLQTVREKIDEPMFKLAKLPLNEILLNTFAILLYGPGMRKIYLASEVEEQLLRSQQIQLASLNATTAIIRNQMILRKVLKQKSPVNSDQMHSYSSNESLNENAEAVTPGPSKKFVEAKEPKESVNDTTPADELENFTGREGSSGTGGESSVPPEVDQSADLLRGCGSGEGYNNLFQLILLRAIQPSPLKACYSYVEMRMAALGVSQLLSSNMPSIVVKTEVPAPASSSVKKIPPPTLQPTMVHGVPIYNINSMADWPDDKRMNDLAVKFLEMGFTPRIVDMAIAELCKLLRQWK